jgi:hypothetical protein
MDMDMGIQGSNNEPQGTNKLARKERANGFVQHDKDDGDINGDRVHRHIRLCQAANVRGEPNGAPGSGSTDC